MKIIINESELYPFYDIITYEDAKNDEIKDYYEGDFIEISDEEGEKINQIMKEFKPIQKRLRELYELHNKY